MNEKHYWRIECEHAPETIDRILAPIRKRGLTVVNMHYIQGADQKATCVLELAHDTPDAERIFKNLLRTIHIHSIIKL